MSLAPPRPASGGCWETLPIASPCRRRSAPPARRARPWRRRCRSRGCRRRRAASARNRHRPGRSAGRRPHSVRARAPADRPPGVAGAARGFQRSLHPCRLPNVGRGLCGRHVIAESGGATGVGFGRSATFRHAHAPKAPVATCRHANRRRRGTRDATSSTVTCSPSPRARARRCRPACGRPARPAPRPARRRAARPRS